MVGSALGMIRGAVLAICTEPPLSQASAPTKKTSTFAEQIKFLHRLYRRAEQGKHQECLNRLEAVKSVTVETTALTESENYGQNNYHAS
jgi:hypothetical protein